MATTGHRYFVVNKPYDMVSQFISSHDVNLLGDLDFDFPPGTHAIGRLDNHSEGLLLLTTNKRVTRLLFLAEEAHQRMYLVQVNNELSDENLLKLQTGVEIRVSGGGFYNTGICSVQVVTEPEKLYPYIAARPVHGKHTWLLISLTEGKFRQVRKMMAAVQHRCKRLIRISIEEMQLGGLAPGAVKEMRETDFFEKLRIKYP